MTDQLHTINNYVLGQIQNNTYLIHNNETRKAILIDPAAGIERVIEDIQKHDLTLTAILITHAHFDHIAGLHLLVNEFGNEIPIFLHPDDMPLWENGGGAKDFGFDFDPHAVPSHFFHHQQQLSFAGIDLEVRHTPGHSPGHVILYWQSTKTAFVGDVIFYHSIGRADLSYSDPAALTQSIKEQILTLPGDTRLLSGHGPQTNVQEEMNNNPFLY